MKKVMILAFIAIGFLSMSSTNASIELLLSFMGGIGIGFAIREARKVGQEEGSSL